jgi:hypothetical protein
MGSGLSGGGRRPACRSRTWQRSVLMIHRTRLCHFLGYGDVLEVREALTDSRTGTCSLREETVYMLLGPQLSG